MSIIVESIQQAALWAWHTSLAAALPVLVLLTLGFWTSFPARGRLVLGALVILRLLMTVVPELPGHPAGWFQTSRPVERVAQNYTGELTGIAPQEDTFTHISFGAWLAMAWSLGVFGVAVWLCYSQIALQRLINREWQPADVTLNSHLHWAQGRMGFTSRVRLIEISGMPTVALWGWLHPHIIVPAGLLERYTADEVRGMFLHELAHVRRHDVLWVWLGLAACALHWFNPLAWLALRRFRMDREIDCDRMALDVLSAPQRLSYGLALLKTLETHLAPAPVALVPFGQAQPNIQTRIRMITHPLPTRLIHRLGLLIIPSSAILIFTAAQADGERREIGQPRAELSEARKPVEPVAAREGEVRKPAGRDGEAKKEGVHDGEARREGARDGEARREGAREGEPRKSVARDGEVKKEGVRDGEARKDGARDGEGRKPAARDGDERKPTAREGARDGEAKKEGVRDGESRRKGQPESEARKPATRDGEERKPATSEGEAARAAAREDAAARDAAVAKGAAATREATTRREGEARRDGAATRESTITPEAAAMIQARSYFTGAAAQEGAATRRGEAEKGAK